MKRWIQKPLSYLKRGVTSLFVCAVVLVPVLSLGQWAHAFGRADARHATPLPAMQLRPVDQTRKAPDLFGEPLITVTFDDGWESIYKAMPSLSKYGIRTTQYVISGTGKDQNYLSDAQLKEIEAAGHELDTHTVTHPDLTTLSDQTLTYELQHSQSDLRRRLGGRFDDFATPYGHVNDHVSSVIEKYYRSQRNTNGDYTNGVNENDVNIAGHFDRYNIIAVTLRHETRTEDLQNLVNYTIAHNGWLVLNYHATDDSPSDYSLDVARITAQMQYLASVKARIVTMGQVLDTIAPAEGQEF
jgi:peptidoglycan/xylan/chitin deacetylase (PgdA/CDA1 family)